MGPEDDDAELTDLEAMVLALLDQGGIALDCDLEDDQTS